MWHPLLAVLLCCAFSFASNISAVDTLVLRPDGKTLSIPFQISSQGTSKKDSWDSSIVVPLPSWKALVTVAQSLEECKADWNRLLELGQQKDSICRAGLSNLQQQSDLEAERSANYKDSWNELIQNQQKCSQALTRCTEVGTEQAKELREAKKSHWWAWLLLGLTAGLVGGISISR
jgi:hypothetical protein